MATAKPKTRAKTTAKPKTKATPKARAKAAPKKSGPSTARGKLLTLLKKGTQAETTKPRRRKMLKDVREVRAEATAWRKASAAPQEGTTKRKIKSQAVLANLEHLKRSARQAAKLAWEEGKAKRPFMGKKYYDKKAWRETA